jgi:serine/threonine protein kinase
LGKGAFGEVKKAVDVKHPNKHLAVKIIPYGGDKDKKKIIE